MIRADIDRDAAGRKLLCDAAHPGDPLELAVRSAAAAGSSARRGLPRGRGERRALHDCYLGTPRLGCVDIMDGLPHEPSVVYCDTMDAIARDCALHSFASARQPKSAYNARTHARACTREWLGGRARNGRGVRTRCARAIAGGRRRGTTPRRAPEGNCCRSRCQGDRCRDQRLGRSIDLRSTRRPARHDARLGRPNRSESAGGGSIVACQGTVRWTSCVATMQLTWASQSVAKSTVCVRSPPANH